MSEALSLPTLPSGVTGPSHIPDLTEAADIQVALKYLYYGSTGAANSANGIYGALTGLKNYVDASISGVNVHETVKMATTAALGTTGNLVGGTITTTYANGTADASGGTGIGATLTIATSSNWTAITIDGQSLSVGNRVLIKDQGTSLQNGIYTVTSVGAVGNTTSFVFTRATDSDNSIAGEMGEGDFTFVSAGTTNGNTSWILTSASPTGTGPTGAIKIGTDPVTFIQFGSVTWGSQTANTVFAAPNGSAGTPTFRALVAADTPNVLALAGGTMTGQLNLATGTTSVAPIEFQPSTFANLVSAANLSNGVVASATDGIYASTNPGTTSTGPGLGLVRTTQMVYSLATSSATSTTLTNVFASANDVLSVIEPAKLYRFKGTYFGNIGTFNGTSIALQLAFTFSNAPTAIKYTIKGYNQSATSQSIFAGASSSTGATLASPSMSSGGAVVVEFEGYFTSHATLTSTLTPQFNGSTGPSTLTVGAGSYFELEKLGSSTQTLIAGNWA